MNNSIAKTVFLLSPMVIALAFAMDIYIPAVPHIAELFHVSAGDMQLTLTIFMIMASLAQLIVGPLSDQFGRKKVSYLMIIIFALGTYFCSHATNLTELVSYRILQAAGSCGMLVVAFAIIRDKFHGPQSGQAYSYLNGIIAFSPMFAPFIGSYLDIHYGWPSTFQSLLIIAIVALVFMFWLMPESLAINARRPITKGIFHEYIGIGNNREFIVYTMATAIGLSYLYIFCSISPYIIIRLLHIPEADYGYYFAFMGVSFFVGSFLSAYMVAKVGIYYTVILGFILSIIGGAIMAGWYFTMGLTINNFIWPMLLIGVGGTFGLGAGGAGAMEPFAKVAGAAAALSGSIRFLYGGLLGSLVVTKHISSTLPLAMTAVICSTIGLAIFIYNKNEIN